MAATLPDVSKLPTPASVVVPMDKPPLALTVMVVVELLNQAKSGRVVMSLNVPLLGSVVEDVRRT